LFKTVFHFYRNNGNIPKSNMVSRVPRIFTNRGSRSGRIQKWDSQTSHCQLPVSLSPHYMIVQI
jgi:hypothetical protein